jgi:hypothetical protein
VLTLAGLEEQAASGDLDVRDALTIAGAGAAITIIDGNGTSGVFEVYSGSLALSGLTVRRGLHEASWAGGISAAAPLTLTDCVVAENHGFAGGGITAVNGVTIVGTTVRDNVADLTAGGLAVVSGTIRDSTFAGNAVSASSGLGAATSSATAAVRSTSRTARSASCSISRTATHHFSSIAFRLPTSRSPT